MAQRFGQAADYSQSFAFLWSQQDQALTYRAEQLEQRTEADQRARDELMFTRYQEGKISGAAILAYIQKRINQTGYSKAEQRKWREALVEYRNNVVDNRATAAYNESGNLHAYIAHWQNRLKSTERGTPERTEISSMLRQLMDQRDATALQTEARRLEREIQAGNKSTKDLIDLYKSKLGTVSPALKEQIRDALSALRKRYKQEQFEESYRKTMDAFQAGRISPQEAADQLNSSANRWGLETLDPARFNQIKSEEISLNGTADPVVVARLAEQLDLGQITATEYKDAMFELARQVGPYNQEAAINIRTYARQQAEEYTLANPGAIGQGTGSGRTAQETLQGAGAVRFISQLDNTKFSLENCTFASAAMLAAMMDKGNKLTGADLRAASRDYSGGGTLLDAQNALIRKGVGGTQVRYDNRVEFEKFKNMIKQGAPASLSGYLGAMKDGSIHNAGLRAGHNIVVVKYDPKKGFLVMDPARSSKEQGKFWMKEADLKTFGWSAQPGSFYRYGQAMFAPKGTFTTRWNQGKDYTTTPGGRGVSRRDGQRIDRAAGGSRDDGSAPYLWDSGTTPGAAAGRGAEGGAEISADGDDVPNDVWMPVTATPSDPDTPIEYANQYAPGPSEVAAAIDRAVLRSMDPELEELMDAGIRAGDPSLVTPRMVEAEIQARNETVAQDYAALVAFAQQWSGDPNETVRVETENGIVHLSLEDAQDIQLSTLSDTQGLILLNDATGNAAGADQMTQLLRGTVLLGQDLTTTEYTTGRSLLFQSTTGEIIRKVAAGDTEGALRAAIDGLDALVDLGDDVTEPDDRYDPLTGQVITSDQQRQDEADTDRTGHVTAVEQAEYDASKLPSSVALADEGKVTSQNDVMGLEALRDMLVGSVESGQPIPWDQLVTTIDAFAQGAGIEMPSGWAEGDAKGGSPEGSSLAVIATNIFDQSRVAGGVANWVHVNGQIYAIGLDQSTIRYDAEGRAVVEDYSTQGQLDNGNTGQVDYSAGMQVQFDPSELKAALEEQAELDEGFAYEEGLLNSPNGLTQIPRMVDGKLTYEFHVPTLEHYGNINFLRVGEFPAELSKMLHDMTGLDLDFEQGGWVDQNTLSMIASAPNGNAFLRAAVSAEIAERVPFEANVIRIEGKENWQDPVTGVWHENGLPWGNGAIPGAEAVGSNTGFVGATINSDLGTQIAVPDVPWASNEEAGRGRPTPKYDNVSADDAQIWYEAQVAAGLMDPVLLVRDENGETARIDPESERAHSWWSNNLITEAKAVADLATKQKQETAAAEQRAVETRQQETEAIVGNWGAQAAQTDDPFALGRMNDTLNEVLKGNQVNPWEPPKPTWQPPSIESAVKGFDIPKVDIPMPTTSAVGDNPGGIAGMTFNPETGYRLIQPTGSAEGGFTPPEPEPVAKPAPATRPYNF